MKKYWSKLFFSFLILQSGYSFPLYSQVSDFIITSEMNLDTSLAESSGIVFVQGKLWTHTDSGGEACIYSVHPQNGSINQTITLEGLANHDWEDIAADESHIYIADTGNNKDGARTDLAIYKISILDIPLEGDAVIPYEKIEIIRFYYPEQEIDPKPVSSNSTAFDCEAIVVLNNTIHLFTKDWTSVESGYESSEYLLPNKAHPEGSKYSAQFLTRHKNLGFLVTGADNRNSEYVVLIGYQYEAMGAICIRLFSNFRNDDLSTGKSDVLVAGSVLNLGQVEAVCFGKSADEGYITNEDFNYNDFSYPAKLKSFQLIGE